MAPRFVDSGEKQMEKWMDRMTNWGFLAIPLMIALVVMLLNHLGCSITGGSSRHPHAKARDYRLPSLNRAIAPRSASSAFA